MPAIFQLMPEMADAGEDHGHVVLVGCCDHFFVPHRPARLDDGCNSGFGRRVRAVTRPVG